MMKYSDDATHKQLFDVRFYKSIVENLQIY